MRNLYLLILLCLAVLAFSGGCDRDDLLTEDLLDSQMASMKIDDLNRTLDFVFSESRFDQKEFEDKISTGLNRWFGEVKNDTQISDDWQVSESDKHLVEQFSDLPELERIDEMTYLNSDGYFVQQAAWLKKIGERICRFEEPARTRKEGEAVPIQHKYKLSTFEFYRMAANDFQGKDNLESFDKIVGILNEDLNESDANSLADAIRLFDWVTRNIQLVPAREIPESEYEDYQVNENATEPFRAGIPGPGYSHYPWQTLLYGRGDYIEKANLFTLLCHQMELDSVMLAVADEAGNTVPWLPAVMIGNELFLFDTQLGLPIPGERLGSVATLSQVRANSEMLSTLDLTVEESTRDNTKYRVRQEQLNELTGLIYVSPESVSRRMKFLEDRLAGNKRMRLACDSSAMIERINEFEGVQPRVWGIGFETSAFRNEIEKAVTYARTNTSLQGKLNWYYTDEFYVDGFVTYRTARNLYFIGKFESERNSRRLNAVEMFYSLMYTDESIAGLATNKGLMYRLGIRQPDDGNFAQFNTKLRSVQSQMEMVRRDTGLFLAQSHFDNGNIGTCSNWLKRVEDKGISDRWNTGIQYLRARAFEATKEYDKAQEIYKKGEFDQFHGNLIRARLLKSAKAQLDSKP